MRETPAERDRGSALLGLGPQKRLSHFQKPRIAQVLHGGDALAVPEMLEKGPAGNAADVNDLGDTERGAEIGLHEVDCPLHVARRNRPVEVLQCFAVVVGMRLQQRRGEELLEGGDGRRIP
jgi:hypothetical protein